MEEPLVNNTIRNHGITITLLVIIIVFVLLLLNIPYTVTTQIKVIHVNTDCFLIYNESNNLSIGDSIIVSIDARPYCFIVQGIKQEHTLLVSGDSYSQLPLLSEGIIEKERTNTLYNLWRKILCCLC